MKSSSLLFGLIGTILIALTTSGINNLQIKNEVDDHPLFMEEKRVLKKVDLLGTYTVKSDKNSKLTLNNDGTYVLIIDVCEKHITLNGRYELTNTKLKLKNTANSYEDLKGNEELSFTILDENLIKSDESLVCTVQGTLFEK